MNGVKLVENTSKHFQPYEPSGRLNGNKHFPSEFTWKLVPTSDFAFWDGTKNVLQTDTFGVRLPRGNISSGTENAMLTLYAESYVYYTYLHTDETEIVKLYTFRLLRCWHKNKPHPSNP